MPISLQEFRAKYPQYDDMSDRQIAENLHKNYYSDIPKDEFFKELNVIGAGRVASDVMKGVKAVPGAIGGMLSSLPGQVYESGKQVLTDPKRAGQNILAGLASGGAGLLNAPANIVDYLRDEAQVIPDWVRGTHTQNQNYDYRAGVGLEGQQKGDELLYGLSQFAPNVAPAIMNPSAAMALHAIGQNENPVTGALVPPAIKGVTSLGGKALIKGAQGASSVGRTAKNMLTGELPASAQAVEDTAKSFGISTLAGDLTKKGTNVQGLTEFAEKTPITNVKALRGLQQDQALQAAHKIAEKSKREMVNQNFDLPGGIKNLERIAKSGGRRAKTASDLLESINNAGEDWNYILKTSGNARLFNNKLTADSLYNKVSDLSSRYGDVSLDRTLNTIEKALSELNELPNTNKDAISVINGLKNDLMQKVGAREPSLLVDEQGKPLQPGQPETVKQKDLSFSNVRNVRSSVSDRINDFVSGQNALVGKKGVGYLEKIKSALDDDLNRFATSNGPELKKAWKEADTFYKKNVVPYKDRALAKALKAESNPDEIFKMFIKNGGAEGDFGTARAAKFYQALDPKGQSAVRYGILKQAAEYATDPTGAFSPAKYATNLEKLAASRAVFFEGAAKSELNGLTNLMRHIERAGQMKTPDTGIKNLPTLITLAAAQTGNLISLGGGSFALKWLVSSPTGKRLLLNASIAKPNSKAFYNNLLKINDLLAKNAEKGSQLLTKEEED